ncbi:unnamed protein product [Amoebophrya sp. A120]|nr:unnamed protein product [Amoebophrya sp. A120]|eukprot:GSA120T00001178001.1
MCDNETKKMIPLVPENKATGTESGSLAGCTLVARGNAEVGDITTSTPEVSLMTPTTDSSPSEGPEVDDLLESNYTIQANEQCSYENDTTLRADIRDGDEQEEQRTTREQENRRHEKLRSYYANKALTAATLRKNASSSCKKMKHDVEQKINSVSYEHLLATEIRNSGYLLCNHLDTSKLVDFLKEHKMLCSSGVVRSFVPEVDARYLQILFPYKPVQRQGGDSAQHPKIDLVHQEALQHMQKEVLFHPESVKKLKLIPLNAQGTSLLVRGNKVFGATGARVATLLVDQAGNDEDSSTTSLEELHNGDENAMPTANKLYTNYLNTIVGREKRYLMFCHPRSGDGADDDVEWFFKRNSEILGTGAKTDPDTEIRQIIGQVVAQKSKSSSSSNSTKNEDHSAPVLHKESLRTTTSTSRGEVQDHEPSATMLSPKTMLPFSTEEEKRVFLHEKTKTLSSANNSPNKTFTFIDLFAGIGGFRLALEALGGVCLGACELDKFARQTYEKNFHPNLKHNFGAGWSYRQPVGVPIRLDECDEFFINDVTRLAFDSTGVVRDCGEEASSRDENKASSEMNFYSASSSQHEQHHLPSATAKVDLLTGGFPCQSFSTLGKQTGVHDPERGGLFFHLVRILRELKPRFFLFENVRGLLTLEEGKPFEKMVQMLECNGLYEVEYEIVDAGDFLPQRRERVYITGALREEKYAHLFTTSPKTAVDVPTGKDATALLSLRGRIVQKLSSSVDCAGAPDQHNPALHKESRAKSAPSCSPLGNTKISLQSVLDCNSTVDRRYFLLPAQWDKVRRQRYQQLHKDGTGRLVSEHLTHAQTLCSNYRTNFFMFSQLVADLRGDETEGRNLCGQEVVGIGGETENGGELSATTTTRDEVADAGQHSGAGDPGFQLKTTTGSSGSSCTSAMIKNGKMTNHGGKTESPRPEPLPQQEEQTNLQELTSSLLDPHREGQKRPRFFTPRECCRLQGFPEDFEIPRKDNLGEEGRFYHQIGNAVVPAVIALVAGPVVEHIVRKDEEENRKRCNSCGTGELKENAFNTFPLDVEKTVLDLLARARKGALGGCSQHTDGGSKNDKQTDQPESVVPRKKRSASSGLGPSLHQEEQKRLRA